MSDPNQLISVCATVLSIQIFYLFNVFLTDLLTAAFCYSLSFWHVRDDGRDTHTQKKGEANASPRNVRVFCRITSVEKACTHGDMVLNCFSLRESNSEVVGHKNQNKDRKDPKMPHGADSNSVR